MSPEKIEKLILEQEVLIPVYLDKWRKIALSTEGIEEKASDVIGGVYALLEKDVPQIIFCDSPYAAITEMLILNSSQDQLGNNLADHVVNCIENQLQNFWHQISLQLKSSVDRKYLLSSYLENPEFILRKENSFDLLRPILDMNQSELVWELWSKKVNTKAIYSFDWMYTAATFDVFTSELDCYYDPRVYEIVERLVFTGGVIFPFERFCFICDRPRVLSFDNQQRLHAEGAPAIQFADGYSLYAYHGVTLPEQYGKLHPNQWQASWLLEEDNSELRRVLIQGIGYDKIAQELGAIELDSHQEYNLLKIDTDIDIEPIYLLKMTCPSTGFIHVLRVPPDVGSAREAIAWVNWGINPEEFSVQT